MQAVSCSSSPLRSRVHVSVTVDFVVDETGLDKISWGFSRFSMLQISFHHFSTLMSFVSFHLITFCDGATGVVGRYLWYLLTDLQYGNFIASHLIPRSGPMLHTSWANFFKPIYIHECSTAVEQAVACAPVTEWDHGSIPGRESFLSELFRGFSTPQRQMSWSFRSTRSPNIISPS